MAGRVLALLSGVALAGCSVVGIRTVEEPAFSVVDRVGAVEIRAYGPRVAAEAVVAGAEEAARNDGFRKVAGYIFGANTQRAKIAMTAPVAQAGERIAMTAPVAQGPAEGGRWRIRFFMPAGSTLENLPVPDDPAVRLVSVDGATMAVLRFSGARDGEAMAQAGRRLLAALEGSDWRASGEVVSWFYDPPWTLPFARRNEVAVAVARK